MTRGYLIFAQDTADVNYSKLATACALSIKLTQPQGYNSVSVITNNPDYFDKGIVDYIIPSGELAGMNSRSRAYDLSPYDETVLLDSDMLFLSSVEYVWDHISNLDLFIASVPQTYKGVKFKYGYYRKVFEDNHWPDVYSAWTYFKKSDISQEFFNTVKLLTDNAEEFISIGLSNTGLETLPTDEAFALALSILGIEDRVVFPEWGFPCITHMKPAVQGWDEHILDWNEKLRFTVNQIGQIKLGIWQQTEILHYVKKELITDSVIQTLRSAL
jgi:hypothetical protein